MEARVKIEKVTMEHVIDMAPRIRAADQREIWAHLNLEPLEALRISIVSPGKHYAAILDGRVEAIFGVCPDDSGGAAIWLIGTDAITENASVFREYSQWWLDGLKKKYSRLYNWVDARNEVALRWADSVGIKASDPVPYGIEQRPFHYVEWRAS